MDIKAYHKAASFNDAFESLKNHPDNAILGGGIWLKFSKKNINTLIDLSGLGLNQIIEKTDLFEIGAMVTLRDFEKHPGIRTLGRGFLSEATGKIMGIGFRNLATVGGSIIGGFPFSDFLTPLLTTEAELVFYPKKEISLQEYMEMKEKPVGILTHIRIRKNVNIGFFKKVCTTALDFAVLNVAVAITDHKFMIAVGARPGTAALATIAMNYLNHANHPDAAAISETARIAMDTLKFGTDNVASEEYRKKLAQVYVARGLKEVIAHEG